jgi:hypothetical protein
MKNIFLLNMVLLLSFNSSAQQILPQYQDTYIYGQWQCIKLDTRGYEKFTLQQAKQLQSSILTMRKNTFYYKNVDFIDSCRFSYWGIDKYDTVYPYRDALKMTYSNKELSKMEVLQPTDSAGHFGCFNDCAIFFFKGDTLINVCGGYTLYFKKVGN